MGTERELSTKISAEFSGDTVSTSGNSVRQRKKRKWDQPAESLVSTGYTASLMQQPYVGVGPLSGITSPLVGVVPSVSMPSNLISTPQFPSAAIPQSTVAIVQKINQDLALKGLIPPSKVQDEIIAREIIINDAEPNIRYKLTKRQTQEEIQGKTGAVVITRGKYRPPNGPIESEKPLYLHISAGAHLKDRTERIEAVDQAASIVEEIMRQGRLTQSSSIPYPLSGQGSAPFSITLYVGLESDGAFNLLGRIRGPNDQYINHIMHEIGATVILRGRGSGHSEGANGEELQHLLHLFISSDNARSLESAKALAEHLLETVHADCFASSEEDIRKAEQSGEQVVKVGQDTRLNNKVIDIRTLANQPIFQVQSKVSKIWMHADKKRTGFLGRTEFYNALKLVTIAWSGRKLTPDLVKAALFGPASSQIPPPVIGGS